MTPSLTTSFSKSSFQSDQQAEQLKGLKVATLISDGFEQSEFEEPVKALRAAGVQVDVLAQRPEQLKEGIQAIQHLNPTHKVPADRLVLDVSSESYDALLLPGGALSVDSMRESSAHLGFVRNFMDAGKPIAVICHGGWLLADAGIAQGVTMTSWPAIRKDLEHAGAVWKDAEVIVDRNVVSSRKPADLPAFISAFFKLLSETAQEKKKATAA